MDTIIWVGRLTLAPLIVHAGALLLNHLGDRHCAEARPYLKRMETECIDTVVVEAYELIDEV